MQHTSIKKREEGFGPGEKGPKKNIRKVHFFLKCPTHTQPKPGKPQKKPGVSKGGGFWGMAGCHSPHPGLICHYKKPGTHLSFTTKVFPPWAPMSPFFFFSPPPPLSHVEGGGPGDATGAGRLNPRGKGGGRRQKGPFWGGTRGSGPAGPPGGRGG